MLFIVTRRAAALLLVALAAGCGTAGDTAAPSGAPEDARAAAYRPPHDAPAIAPDALLGMTATAVTGLLGQPTFLRREGPAQVWQYRSDLCLVDLFFYPPKAQEAAGGAALQVTYAELRRSGAAEAGAANRARIEDAAQGARCLAVLRDRHSGAGAG